MSLTTAVRSLRRTYLKKFPGVPDVYLNAFLKRVFDAAVTNPKSTYKDEDAITEAEAELDKAAARGETWAVNLRDAVLVNTIKPIVDKANAKGVDPLAALVLADFSDEQAREYVSALEQRDEVDVEGAEIELEQSDEDGDAVAGSGEADTDPYAGTSADAVGSSY